MPSTARSRYCPAVASKGTHRLPTARRRQRRPRSRGTNRHNQISNLVSIHARPPEVEDRLIPNNWEDDLIIGINNRFTVGTLVERTKRLVILAKVDGTTAADALSASVVVT